MQPLSLQQSSSHQGPFLVGREREQAALRQAHDSMLDGHGLLVLIGGEAGIGKTSLAEELLHRAEATGARTFTGGCYDLTTTPPYGPWLEVIKKMRERDDLPSFPPALDDADTLTSAGSQAALFDDVRVFLGTLVVDQPLVLVLEDLHWADQASLDLLRYLGRQLQEQRILLLATYREDELTREHPLFTLLPLIARESGALRLDLQRFDRDAIGKLVESYGLVPPDRQRLVSYLEKRAEGNPFFTLELLRSLEAEGVLRTTDRESQLATLDESYLPTFVRQVIERRLTGLNLAARQALETAAVIGHEFSLDLWETISQQDQEALDHALYQALELHILEETSNRQRLRFSHALVREVLYNGLLPTQRRHLHRRTAELLEQSHADPDSIAYHYGEAGDHRAIDWFIRAGKRAMRSYTVRTALDRYAAGLEILRLNDQRIRDRGRVLFHLGQMLHWYDAHDAGLGLSYLEEARRIGDELGDRLLSAAAIFQHGINRCMRSEIRPGLAEMESALDMLENVLQEEPPDSTEDDLLAVDVDLPIVRAALATWQSSAGYLDQAEANAEEIVSQAAASRVPLEGNVALAGSFLALGRIRALRGNAEDATEAFEQSRRAYRDITSAIARRQVVSNASSELSFVVVPYWPDDVARKQHITEVVLTAIDREQAADASKDDRVCKRLPLLLLEGKWSGLKEQLPGLTTYFSGTNQHDAILGLAVLARHQGDVEVAWEMIRGVLPDGPSTEPGTSWFFYGASLQRVAVDLALDSRDLDTARVWLEAHDGWLDWSGAVLGRADGERLWARFYLEAENPEQSIKHAGKAMRLASRPRQPLVLIAVHRLLGELALKERRFGEASEHLQFALGLAHDCAAPFEQARTKMLMAELAAAMDQTDDCQRIIAEVRMVCEPFGATPVLERADRLEARSGRRIGDYPAGLSPREVEVLQFVVQGLTDAEIAERLFISRHTVMRHVSNILGKLNVESRTAAAAFAVRNGLA